MNLLQLPTYPIRQSVDCTYDPWPPEAVAYFIRAILQIVVLTIMSVLILGPIWVPIVVFLPWWQLAI